LRSLTARATMTAMPAGDLAQRLPPDGASDDEILERFLEHVAALGLSLYPAQEEAILEAFAGKNVILNTPTGSGKSLVAAATHFRALARRERSFYTSPIKALASEKFFALSRDFGPENVGLLTGDAAINHDAPIVCCTAEILANLALREGADAKVDHVVMDEFHYYADKERGTAWQVPLLELRRATFLLMSATLGDTTFFESALTELNGRGTAVIRNAHRPVPIEFSYSDTPLHEIVAHLVKVGRAPIYLVNFTQRSAAEEAQNLMSVDVSTKEEKRAISDAMVGTRFDSPFGKEIQRFLRHGIGLHHAGLLPKYRLLVEKLAQRGLLKIISGTDTLGVGVNIPIRTVLFTKLCKFDGEKTAILPVREFLQISGRAGRKGFDDQGYVVVQAPEHVIENLRLEAKASSDPAKRKKIVKKKPPEWGYVHWDKSTFDRLTTNQPEALTSRFQVSHAMVLSVLQRRGSCLDVFRVVARSHERPPARKILRRTAMSMLRSLVDAGIVSREGGRLRVAEGLQEDFSLNQTLSLYLVETIGRLDRELPTYALDVLSLVESILENPDFILQRQLDKLKTEKMAEMKAAGLEYEERMAELEKLEYPKPNRDFIYDTFNEFSREHPWVGGENIRPKSIARDMVERFFSFGEYVREYGLERAEGALLRYLSDVYKTLVQTVPEQDKNDELDEIVTYFRAMVRQVDSSLVDEWESMRSGGRPAPRREEEEAKAPGLVDVTADERGFVVLVRNACFAIVRALARRDWEGAAALFGSPDYTLRRVEQEMGPYFAEHSELRTDADARSPTQLKLDKSEWEWTFAQNLLDADGPTGWAIEGIVDLEGSRVEGRAVLRVKALRAP
jgi:superfamily II RNA helicase